ncbi:peptidylprolyl isomerase [Prosthecobacter sp.]|uniref:peptidylprolyl isomerase n=1 Tax=Prosthecobacter sp. TaxID=1965333 RepID=UPI0037847526
MKLLRACLPLVFTFHSAALAAEAAPDNGAKAVASPQEADPPVATVDGAVIRTSDLRFASQAEEDVIRKRYADSPARLPQALAELRDRVLDRLIDQQLLLNEFKHLGGVLKPEVVEEELERIVEETFKGDHAAFLAELKTRGQTIESFRKLQGRMMTIAVMRMRLAGEVAVTPQEAREYYDKRKDRWSGDASVKFHTVSIPKASRKPVAEVRREAEELLAKLIKGEDFGAVARKWSSDSRAEYGGTWDWMAVADLTDPLREAVDKTATGKFSELIDQADTFIILRLDDYRTPTPTPPFEKVQEDIVKLLEKQKYEEKIEAAMEKLSSAAKIQKLAQPEK